MEIWWVDRVATMQNLLHILQVITATTTESHNIIKLEKKLVCTMSTEL